MGGRFPRFLSVGDVVTVDTGTREAFHAVARFGWVELESAATITNRTAPTGRGPDSMTCTHRPGPSFDALKVTGHR